MELESCIEASNHVKEERRAQIQRFSAGGGVASRRASRAFPSDLTPLPLPDDDENEVDSAVAQITEKGGGGEGEHKAAARPTSPSGSLSSSVQGGEDSVNDIVMLQHSLLRVLAPSVMIDFLGSPDYHEVLSLLRSEKVATNQTIEAELAALASEVRPVSHRKPSLSSTQLPSPPLSSALAAHLSGSQDLRGVGWGVARRCSPPASRRHRVRPHATRCPHPGRERRV